MRLIRIAATIALASLAACDCGSDEEAEPAAAAGEGTAPAEEDDALRAASIAREIRAAPDDSEAILERHGLTIEEFEALLYDVAADPAASERYEEALAAE